jgi:predicted acetyltransferase
MSSDVKASMKVRELREGDEAAFLDAVEDWRDEDLSWLTFHWHPVMSHEEHLQILADHKSGVGVPEDFVPSTMLYGFVDGVIVGRVHVRHRLNDNLLRRGGHMGYSVAPRFRGKGYGHALAQAGVWYLRERLNIADILITCNDDHLASIKIIERLGARLEDVYADPRGFVTRRYWI